MVLLHCATSEQVNAPFALIDQTEQANCMNWFNPSIAHQYYRRSEQVFESLTGARGTTMGQ